ncbi:MAG TPA: response regulator transcription factor [Chthoniobacterales bacterium]
MSLGDSTVFVVDDDPSVRRALCSLFRSVGLRCELFESAKEFLKHKRPEVSSCIVLNVRLPGLSGLELQRQLADAGGEIPIVFITGHGDIPMSVHAMKAGAVDFLTKPFRDQQLLDAIQAAIARDATRREQRARTSALHQRYASLTLRERQVLGLVADGLPNKQVADRLGTSEITVKIHRGHLMRKMEAESLADLVRMADRIRVRHT